MKIIITCDAQNYTIAQAVASAEIAHLERYDKPGWGWPEIKDGVRFFVRGIKGGISITQTAPKMES